MHFHALVVLVSYNTSEYGIEENNQSLYQKIAAFDLWILSDRFEQTLYF